MITVATALTLGSSPRRAREKITSGMVVAPGPLRKAETTTSSSDRLNVSSQADSSDCAIMGSVTSVNTCHGRAPRSMAASSSCGLSVCRRALTTTVAYDIPIIRWPSQIVTSPRSGKPIACWIATSISSSDRPWITSGITSGALTMPEKNVRPVNRRYLTSENAAIVPRTTEPLADSSAILNDSHRPLMISESSASFAYHSSEKPPQCDGRREWLNEKTTSVTIGR